MSATLKPPTRKALDRWYAALPAEAKQGDKTCSYCGKVGPWYHVQPQHPFFSGGITTDGREIPKGTDGCFSCSGCIDRRNQERRAEHRKVLDAMPKCGACGKRRGNWTVAGVLLCGRCKTKAMRKVNQVVAGAGWLAMTWNPDRKAVLKMAGAPASLFEEDAADVFGPPSA